MARQLTEPQIDVMIHLLQEAQKSSRLGYNINVPILEAANYWRRDIQIQEEVEAATGATCFIPVLIILDMTYTQDACSSCFS